jgi:hypothetical protein
MASDPGTPSTLPLPPSILAEATEVESPFPELDDVLTDIAAGVLQGWETADAFA